MAHTQIEFTQSNVGLARRDIFYGQYLHILHTRPLTERHLKFLQVANGIDQTSFNCPKLNEPKRTKHLLLHSLSHKK